MKITSNKKIIKIITGILAIVIVLSCSVVIFSCKDKNKDEINVEIPDFDFMNEDLTKYVTLGQYKGFKLRMPKIPKITEQDIENQIEYDLIASKLFNKITDRKVMESDTVSIKYKGFMNGEEFEGGSGEKDMFTIFNGGGFIDGFAKGLIGAEVGKEVELNLTFPKDYGHKDLAGKPVVFKVTVDYIYGAVELSDEIAKKLTGNQEMNVNKLKEDYRDKMEQKIEKQHKEIKINLVWNEIFSHAKKITLPQYVVDGYFKIEQQYYESLGKLYGFSYEKVLEIMGLTEEKIMKQVEENLYNDMIFYSVIKAENITLSPEDYENQLVELMEKTGASKEEILDKHTEEELKDMFLTSKGYDAAIEWQEFEYFEKEEEISEPKYDFMGKDLTKFVTLGKYKGIEIKVPEIEILTDEKIQEQIKKDMIRNQVVDKITNRNVLESDTVSIKYTGYMDGKEFEGGSGNRDFFTIYDGGGFIPGFAEGLIGAEVGKEVILNIKFPDDYKEDLAGKPVTFKVIVEHIYVPKELTDELTQKITGEKDMTVKKFYEKYRETLQNKIENNYNDMKWNKVWDAIVSNATEIELPADLVEHFYKYDRQYYKRMAAEMGMPYEVLLGELKLTDEILQKRAHDNVLRDIVVYSVIKAENLTMNDEEFENHLEKVVKESGMSKEDFLNKYSKEDLRAKFLYEIIYEKAEEWQNIIIDPQKA